MTKPMTALIILDGFGCSKDKEFNAIKPTAREYLPFWEQYPHTQIAAMAWSWPCGWPDGNTKSATSHWRGADRLPELTASQASLDGDSSKTNVLSRLKTATARSALHLMGCSRTAGLRQHHSTRWLSLRATRDSEGVCPLLYGRCATCPRERHGYGSSSKRNSANRRRQDSLVMGR